MSHSLFLTGLLPSSAPLCFGCAAKVATLDKLPTSRQKFSACKMTHTPDNLIYLVVSVPHKTFIARLDNSRLTPVVDFGRHFEIAPSALQISTLKRQNMEPDKCLLIFNAKYGSSECGLIDIDGTTVKVVHFDFPSQNLGTYPPVHYISTPN